VSVKAVSTFLVPSQNWSKNIFPKFEIFPFFFSGTKGFKHLFFCTKVGADLKLGKPWRAICSIPCAQ
jgi:hypothetical protein